MLPKYLRRMRRRGGYVRNLSHRFGGHPRLPPKGPHTRRIWLQAVSVGEVLAVGPILEALRREGVEVYLTATTSTGYRLADDRYQGLTVGIGYFPIDWWLFSARAWRRIAPDMAILTEGERWPEHVRQARRRGVPIININARISDRSFGRLRFCRRWAPAVPRLLLAGITRVLACSQPGRRAVPGARIPVGAAAGDGQHKAGCLHCDPRRGRKSLFARRTRPAAGEHGLPWILDMARRGAGPDWRLARRAGRRPLMQPSACAAACRAKVRNRAGAEERADCGFISARAGPRRPQSTSRSRTRPANCAA